MPTNMCGERVQTLQLIVFALLWSGACANEVDEKPVELNAVTEESEIFSWSADAEDAQYRSPDSILGGWSVPYLCQKNYVNIKESACGPTSVTMLLRYYFPNARVDVPEIYHAGTQTYGYHGPAYGYQNVSFQKSGNFGGDPGFAAVPDQYEQYYSGTYSGMTASSMLSFLNRVWGMSYLTVTTESAVYSEILKGPLLTSVYALGNTAYGHYLVVTGIDDRGTSSHSDDYIIVNDPYDWTSPYDCSDSAGKRITYNEFFVKGAGGSKWFRTAYRLIPVETTTQAKYTVVVDTGNNTYEGNTAANVFYLDSHSANNADGTPVWKFYYGSGGDWYYPTVSNRAARWTPRLSATGSYEVSVKYLADSTSGSVVYTIYDATGKSLAAKTVNQYASASKWSYTVLSSSIKLSNGSYVRASSIPAKTNIDAVKFKYLSP